MWHKGVVDTPSPTPLEHAPRKPLADGVPIELPDYQILGCIGQGGMGAVYKARHKTLGTLAAIKFLPVDLVNEPKAVARFQREAAALAALKHPNIVTVFSFQLGANYLALAMELVDGVPLSKVLENERRLSADRTAGLILQLLDALGFAHANGIVHRDVKPSNILFMHEQSKETIKVIDFGLARKEDPSAQKLTTTGALMGTPRYMSPEQCLGQPADARSDLYAVGCIMYECLTGKPFADGETAMEVMLAHVNADITTRDAAELGNLAGVVQKALAKNPEDRFQSADEFAGALQKGDVPATKRIVKRKSAGLAMRGIAIGAVSAIIALATAFNMTRQRANEKLESFADEPLQKLIATLDEDVLENRAVPGALVSAINAATNNRGFENNLIAAHAFQRAFGMTGDRGYLELTKIQLRSAVVGLHLQRKASRNEICELARIAAAENDVHSAEELLQHELSAYPNAGMETQGELHYGLLQLYTALGDVKLAKQQENWLNQHQDEIDAQLGSSEKDYMVSKNFNLAKDHWRAFEALVNKFVINDVGQLRQSYYRNVTRQLLNQQQIRRGTHKKFLGQRRQSHSVPVSE